VCGYHHRNYRHDWRGGQAVADPPIIQTGAEQRVSSADRERVIDQLRVHAGQGRLDLDEFAARVDEALDAKTGRELGAVLRKLPRIRTAGDRRVDIGAILRPYLLVNALLIAIWAVTGAGYFWPIFPLVGWGIGVARNLFGTRSHLAEHQAS
jgi:hypothetical protein